MRSRTLNEKNSVAVELIRRGHRLGGDRSTRHTGTVSRGLRLVAGVLDGFVDRVRAFQHRLRAVNSDKAFVECAPRLRRCVH
jgi:hypothetical protein